MDFLFKIFSMLFKDQLESIKEQERALAILNERDRETKERKSVRFIELAYMIGKPVMVISNEWENPVIGICLDVTLKYHNRPTAIVKDYITNETGPQWNKLRYYFEQSFNALMKLDPYERWVLLTNSCSTMDKPQLYGDILTKEEIIQRLTENGFYKELEKLKRKEIENEHFIHYHG